MLLLLVRWPVNVHTWVLRGKLLGRTEARCRRKVCATSGVGKVRLLSVECRALKGGFMNDPNHLEAIRARSGLSRFRTKLMNTKLMNPGHCVLSLDVARRGSNG